MVEGNYSKLKRVYYWVLFESSGHFLSVMLWVMSPTWKGKSEDKLFMKLKSLSLHEQVKEDSKNYTNDLRSESAQVV